MRTDSKTKRSSVGRQKVQGSTILFVTALIGLPFLFGYWTHQPAPMDTRPTIEPQKLAVQEGSLDFGERPPIESFSWTLPVKNLTDRVIEVLDFELGCLCTEVTPQAFSVKPGETQEVKVVVDLQPANDEDLVKSVREFASTIKPIFKGGWPKQDAWQLTGRILNPYRVEPAFINYDDTLVSGLAFPPQQITVTASQSLEALEVECDPPFGTASVQRRDGQEREFVVHFTPHSDLQIGRYDLTLRLQGICKDGSKLPRTGVRVFAHVRPDVEVFPSVVHLGALKSGQDAKANVVLRSRSGRPYELLGIEHENNEDLKIEEREAAGADRTFELRCQVNKAGLSVSKVKFSVKSGAGNDVRHIPLVVCYSGLEAPGTGDGQEQTPVHTEIEEI